MTGEQPVADQQGDFTATAEEAFEGNGAGGGAPPQAGARPDELGNSRGKRMAMKFVNKIASKEKYTQVITVFMAPCWLLLSARLMDPLNASAEGQDLRRK